MYFANFTRPQLIFPCTGRAAEQSSPYHCLPINWTLPVFCENCMYMPRRTSSRRIPDCRALCAHQKKGNTTFPS